MRSGSVGMYPVYPVRTRLRVTNRVHVAETQLDST